MTNRPIIKVIIDTNLFISFLIGKGLINLKDNLIEAKVELIFSEQSIKELQIVTQREKFRKYFPIADVENLIAFFKRNETIIKINKVDKVCRDPKDDFLLALAIKSKANYLVTGDNDLLVLKKHQFTKIISIKEFEKVVIS